MLHNVFIRIDPKGSYYKTDPQDSPNPATRIRLSRFGFEPGDWIGLRSEGKFKYGRGERFPEIGVRVGAVFAKSDGRTFLNPSQPSQHTRIVTPPTWPGGRQTDIEQDFTVTRDERLVRIPDGAEYVLFAPPDSYYEDNLDPDKDYGVRVSLGNNPPHPRFVGGDAVLHTDDQSTQGAAFSLAEGARDSDLSASSATIKNRELSDNRAVILSSSTGRQIPQYRGWYFSSGGRPMWKPKLSRWKGRISRNHYGIDLFWPQGTAILSPVDGVVTGIGKPGTGFGNHIIIAFKRRGKRYDILFAHLDHIDLTKRQKVTKNMQIGLAGCTESPGSCGSTNRCGGRSDHVHIEVVAGRWRRKRGINIVKRFRWKVKYARKHRQRGC